MGSNMAEAHPVGLPVGDGGQGARREGVPHRPAVHPDQRAGRSARAAAGRHRHRVPRRGDQLHPRQRAGVPRVRPAYTNAPFLVSEHYQDTEDLDGLFSGYDPDTASYDRSSWQYQSHDAESASGSTATRSRRRPTQHGSGGPRAGRRGGRTRRPTRRCSIRAACSRSSNGTSPGTRRRWSSGSAACRQDAVPEQVAGPGRRIPAGTAPARWSTRVGWTQHTVGAQYIRAGGHHPAAAGQHRPPGRRHIRAARARQHPGLHRHADAVQPAARLPADAGRHARRTWPSYLEEVRRP